MKERTIYVPVGSNVNVEVTGDGVKVSLEPKRRFPSGGKSPSGVVSCDVTGRWEELPDMGQVAILWNDGRADKAVVSKVESAIFGDEGRWLFVSSEGKAYPHAVRFRAAEQYFEILEKGGVCHGVEASEADER